MPQYTVVGFYPDSDQRFGEVIDAPTAAQAELDVVDQYPGVLVVGVVAGAAWFADTGYATHIGSEEAREKVFYEPVRK